MVETSDAIINIDTTINSNSTNSECPICFDSMADNDPVLIIDCCLKTVHLSCIMEWYSKRPDNKICFMCNQTNNFCKDITYDTSYYDILDETEISSSATQIDNSTTITIDTNYSCQIIIKIVIIIFLTGLMCWGLVKLVVNI